MIYYQDPELTLMTGDALTELATLPDGSADCVVTSPPYYGLRDYDGHPDQLGLERSPADYVASLAKVFAEVWRVLASDGTVWLNLGDSYASASRATGRNDSGTRTRALPGRRSGGLIEGGRRIHLDGADDRADKNLLGIPWRTAFALQDSGWYLRNAIVWHKTNAMPESVTDRVSKRYELVFLLTKSKRYYFDLDAIRETPRTVTRVRRNVTEPANMAVATVSSPHTGYRGTHENGRNPGDVWTLATRPLPAAHFAAFPIDLPRRCIAAGCKPGGVVLDPFSGAGTTAMAALGLGRRAIGLDIVTDYHDIALHRMCRGG